MRTRYQERTSQMEELKEETPPVAEELERPANLPEEALEDVASFELLEDVAASLKIESLDDAPEEKLQKILEILAEQQNRLKEECARKLRTENENAENMKTKLLRRIDALSEEFLDGPADDEALGQIRMPVQHNMPSCAVGRSNATQLRVVRVFNKDTDADQMLAEWTSKYEEIAQLLSKENDAIDED